jgi:hypothetical protein
MLGLDGFRVMDVQETAAELVIHSETTLELVGCPGCGVVATAQDRMPVAYRDLAAFGRPARLVWSEAALALPGAAVRDAHLDRELERLLAPLPAHPPRGQRVLPAGGPERPPGGDASVLERPESDLPPARRYEPARPLPAAGVTKSY